MNITLLLDIYFIYILDIFFDIPMSASKKKCSQYNTEYLKYGFIPSPVNNTLPMCMICEKTFSNEAMNLHDQKNI